MAPPSAAVDQSRPVESHARRYQSAASAILLRRGVQSDSCSLAEPSPWTHDSAGWLQRWPSNHHRVVVERHRHGRRRHAARCHVHRAAGTGDNGAVTLYRDDGVVLRVQKLGEADRIVTMLTRRTGRVRAVAKGVRRTKSQVRRQPRAVQPRRLPALRRPRARHRHPGRDRRPRSAATSSADYGRYTAGHRDARDRRAAHRRGARAVDAAVPAAGRRSAVARRGRARARTRPRCLCAAGAGRRRATSPSLDTCARCDIAGSAPLLRPVGRRRGLRRLPAGRVRSPRRGESMDLLAALLDGRLGARRRERPAAPARGAAAWSRPTCSGTSSGAAVAARWSSAGVSRKRAGTGPPDARTPPGATAAAASPRTCCPGTSRS